ncbi:MAG: peptidoglycan-binding protein [Acidimicrobiia bacterium]
MSEPRKPFWKRPIVLGVGAMLIVTGVAFALFASGGTTETTSGETLNTALVLIADLVDESTYDGTLGRPEPETLTAGTAGVVTSSPEPGDVISSGEVLFEIGDDPVVLLEGSTPAFRDLALGDTQAVVPAGRSGTLTWLISEGDIVESGDVYARVDDKPVVALEGSIPMYRVLRSGVEGEDVLQLEEALVALGFDPDGEVTVDEEFSSSTTAMVKRWQESLGVAETGRVLQGEVLFVSLPAQALAHQTSVGLSVSPATALFSASGGDSISGSDVRQLEDALIQLGYDPGTVDGVYDTATASAVSLWTDDKGMVPQGWLPLGSIVFKTGDLRVADRLAAIGTAVSAQAGVISATPEETIVRMDLPAEDQEVLSVGTGVVIVLPDRSETTGTVSSVATVAQTSQQGAPATFDVEISLDDPSVVGLLDEAPVDVRVVSDSVENVVAVPVSALLALAEGGYAVEVVEGDSTRLVAVDPGFFGGGLVEVSGQVEAGMIVVVP